jgi:hypothetical protein
VIKKITMKQGDRVAIIEHGEIKQGIIKDVKFLDRPVAIVDFDGEIRKVLVEDLGKVVTDEETSKDHSDYLGDNLEEKSEITITPEEFRKIGIKIVDEEIDKLGPGGELLGLSFTIFLAKLHKALFIYEAEND